MKTGVDLSNKIKVSGINFYLLALLAAFPMLSIAGQSKQVNSRAFSCEAIDFAELNSLDFNELEQFHCSAAVGSKSLFDRAAAIPSSDVNGTIAANKYALSESRGCLKIITTTGDIARRRFSGQKFACDEYRLKRP